MSQGTINLWKFTVQSWKRQNPNDFNSKLENGDSDNVRLANQLSINDKLALRIETWDIKDNKRKSCSNRKEDWKDFQPQRLLNYWPPMLKTIWQQNHSWPRKVQVFWQEGLKNWIKYPSWFELYMQRSNQLGNLESLNCKNNKIVDGSKKTNLTMTLPPATRSLKTHQDLHQDRHGGFLAGKESIVAATSPTCRCRCHRHFLFLKIQPRTKPWLPCLPWRPCS